MDTLKSFESAVTARCSRRGSSADATRFRYANARIYASLAGHPASHALYVGVGHGLDALLALEDGLAQRVTGVDPFVGEHGNDEGDYHNLLELIGETGLADRFRLVRATVQEYIEGQEASFDLIICNDVLHHIFVTETPLQRSDLADEAESLFRAFHEVCTSRALLVIGEPERHGPRQVLTHIGLLGGSVEYSTKQASGEWRDAATRAGWRFVARRYYVPWRLRRLESILSGSLGRWTVCDKYLLSFIRGSSS